MSRRWDKRCHRRCRASVLGMGVGRAGGGVEEGA
jgi:hypothetical protein